MVTGLVNLKSWKMSRNNEYISTCGDESGGKMTSILWLLLGLVVGTNLGVIMMAVLVAGRRADEYRCKPD